MLYHYYRRVATGAVEMQNHTYTHTCMHTYSCFYIRFLIHEPGLCSVSKPSSITVIVLSLQMIIILTPSPPLPIISFTESTIIQLRTLLILFPSLSLRASQDTLPWRSDRFFNHIVDQRLCFKCHFERQFVVELDQYLG